MAIVQVEVSDELLESVRQLAERLYGTADEATIGRVTAIALRKRLELLDAGGETGKEIEEPEPQWESEETTSGEAIGEIRSWLFRRGA